MDRMPDDFTEQHFQNWLTFEVHLHQVWEVERMIRALVADDPTIIEGRSWPELRRIAEAEAS